ncbi:MAG: flagellar biosynthetic protein FliR [Desulfovibrio sp.]|nr:flagellar biosynthetic protein FliR [Desulfovibrio sp.]
MDIFNYNPGAVLSIILTMTRVSIVMFMLPIFSTNNIPVPVKAAATIVITLGVWPRLALSGAHMPAHPFDLVLMLLGEVFIGLVLSMAINFLFLGIQSGGELLGFQMGFTMINFADPLTGNNTGITAFFIWMASLLTFLALNGHLYMLKGFAASFQIIPPGALFVGDDILWNVLNLSAQLFILALKIAAPVMVALFMVEVALGLVARTSPQVHIMEFGFPIKIGVGFFFVGLLLFIMAQQIEEFITGMDAMMENLMRSMSDFHR